MNVLATGGGTSDRHIRIWNVCSGACLSTVDAHSQVRYEHQLGEKHLLAAHLHRAAGSSSPEVWERRGPCSPPSGEHQHKQLVLPVLLPLLRSVLFCGQQTTRSSFQAMALHRISWLYGSIRQ